MITRNTGAKVGDIRPHGGGLMRCDAVTPHGERWVRIDQQAGQTRLGGRPMLLGEPTDGQLVGWSAANGRFELVDPPSGGGSYTPTIWDGYAAAQSGNFTTTPITVPIDTVRPASDIVGTLASGELAVTAAGRYEVTWQATTEYVVSGGSRSQAETWLERDGGDDTWVEVAGTRGSHYAREVNEGDATAAGSALLTLVAGEKVRIRVVRHSGGATTLRTRADGNRLQVEAK